MDKKTGDGLRALLQKLNEEHQITLNKALSEIDTDLIKRGMLKSGIRFIEHRNAIATTVVQAAETFSKEATEYINHIPIQYPDLASTLRQVILEESRKHVDACIARINKSLHEPNQEKLIEDLRASLTDNAKRIVDRGLTIWEGKQTIATGGNNKQQTHRGTQQAPIVTSTTNKTSRTTHIPRSSARDDFSEQVKKSIAKRVGEQCSNPECKASTSGPHTVEAKAVSVGVCAHITAAAPGGPRYNPNLTTEERKSANNAVWLCQNCAKRIDNDEQQFPESRLREWKKTAEDNARESMGKTKARHQNSSQPNNLTEISATDDNLPLELNTEWHLEDPPSKSGYDLLLANRGTKTITGLRMTVEIKPHPFGLAKPGKGNGWFNPDINKVDAPIHPPQLHPREKKPIARIRCLDASPPKNIDAIFLNIQIFAQDIPPLELTKQLPTWDNTGHIQSTSDKVQHDDEKRQWCDALQGLKEKLGIKRSEGRKLIEQLLGRNRKPPKDIAQQLFSIVNDDAMTDNERAITLHLIHQAEIWDYSTSLLNIWLDPSRKCEQQLSGQIRAYFSHQNNPGYPAFISNLVIPLTRLDPQRIRDILSTLNNIIEWNPRPPTEDLYAILAIAENYKSHQDTTVQRISQQIIQKVQ